MSTQELRIDDEFAALIPPLTDDEYSRLEQSIIAEGCRDPIITWNGIIVDGHHRFKICKMHNIDFQIVQKEFASRKEVFLWMIQNQLARRNLNDLQRIEIVRKYENAVKALAKLRQRGGQGGILLPEILPEANRNEARDELGAMAGVSGKTYQHATVVLDKAPLPVIDAARNNSISINAAYEVTKLPLPQQSEIAQRIEQGESAKSVISEVKSRNRKSQPDTTTANSADNVQPQSTTSEASFRNEELNAQHEANTTAMNEEKQSQEVPTPSEAQTPPKETPVPLQKADTTKALGLNMDDLFHYHNYFRRRVIQYLDAARSGKRTPSAQGNLDIQDRYTGELRDIMGRDFFKKRKGTLQDYITDYVQANAEVRAQLAQDIETMKTLEYIRKNHDIAPRLRKQHNIKSQQLEIDYDGSQTFSQSGDEEQKTIHDVIPEGYEAFDPSATRLIETAQSAPENLMHMVANDIAEQHGIPVDDILERLGIQNDNNLMVIPTEIANTLRKMAKSRHRGMLGQAAKDFTTWWKRSVLFTPTRNLLYNIRNFTGDLDALIAGNPKALRHLPHAVRELTGWYTQHGKEGYEASQDLQDYIRLSGNLGIQSLNLSAKDAQAIVSLLDTGQTEKDASKIKSLWNKSLKPIRKFFNAEHSFTEWREHLLRYAAYLEYKQQMESNKDGRPSNWGASIEDEVMSIEDIKERAFKMSNELLGAYDQVSEVGKQLRDMLIPFYSWMEVNMRRTYRLLKNGFKYGYGTQQVKNLGVGKLAAMPLYAFSAGQSVVKLMAFTMALQMFNRMVFPQADDDLPNDVKYRPHITLGSHNGRTYYFDRIGAVADVLDWASLDSAWLDAKDFANGQKSIGSWLKQIAQAPFSKAINGLNPAIKMPIELAMGRSMFPNAFNPSTIRDPAEYVARSFGLA